MLIRTDPAWTSNMLCIIYACSCLEIFILIKCKTTIQVIKFYKYLKDYLIMVIVSEVLPVPLNICSLWLSLYEPENTQNVITASFPNSYERSLT